MIEHLAAATRLRRAFTPAMSIFFMVTMASNGALLNLPAAFA